MAEAVTKPVPFVLTQVSAGPLVPVIDKPATTKERLDAAFAQIEKLGAAITAVREQRFVARTTAGQRWVLESEWRTVGCAAGLSGGVVLGALAGFSACMGTHLSLPYWVGFALAAGAASFLGGWAARAASDRLSSRVYGAKDRLTTEHLAPTLDVIRSMPHAERALVVTYVDDWRTYEAGSGQLTPQANEALMEAVTVDANAYGPELRAARAAKLVEDFRYTHSYRLDKTWREKLEGLLSDCPPAEKSELGEALIDRIFPNEKCIATLTPAPEEELYHLLRNAQKTNVGDSEQPADS